MTSGEQRHVEPELEAWRETVPPCTVVPSGTSQQIAVHIPHGDEVVVKLTAIRAPHVEAAQCDADSAIGLRQLDVWHEPQELDGALIGRATFEIPDHLESGYYRLELISDNRAANGLVLITPQAIYGDFKGWGLALDLATVRSKRSWGIGDLADLGELAVLSAGWGSDYAYVRPQALSHLRFPGEGLAPADFLAQEVRNRYLPAVLLRIEEIPELAYLTAPDRALIEWEAEEFHKINASADAIDTPTIARAKTAALQLIDSVALSPARQAEFDAFVAREGRRLADFALWAAIAENCHQTDTDWPEDAQTPEAFGARRAGDELANQIEQQKRRQWYIAQQLERAHQRMRAAGARIGLIRHESRDATDSDLTQQADWFRSVATGAGAVVAQVQAPIQDLPALLSVTAIEAERTKTGVILDVQNEQEAAAARQLNLPTTTQLWREDQGQRALNTESFAPQELLEIATPLDMPLAAYLTEDFLEALTEDFSDHEQEELRRDAANAHDNLVQVLADAGLLEAEFSQRSLIEALHAWAVRQPPRFTTLRLRDVVGQREWPGSDNEKLWPLRDAFGAVVVVDELSEMPALRSLLRRL